MKSPYFTKIHSIYLALAVAVVMVVVVLEAAACAVLAEAVAPLLSGHHTSRMLSSHGMRNMKNNSYCALKILLGEAVPYEISNADHSYWLDLIKRPRETIIILIS